MAKKNRNKFAEPEGGWIFHPDGGMCIGCTKLMDDCSHIQFDQIKIVLDTYEGHKVVKCSERVAKEVPIVNTHTKEYITEFIRKYT